MQSTPLLQNTTLTLIVLSYLVLPIVFDKNVVSRAKFATFELPESDRAILVNQDACSLWLVASSRPLTDVPITSAKSVFQLLVTVLCVECSCTKLIAANLKILLEIYLRDYPLSFKLSFKNFISLLKLFNF